MKMKTKTVISILMILLTFFNSPFALTIAKPQLAQVPTTNFVIGIPAEMADWDPSIYVPSPQEYYCGGTLETLVRFHEPTEMVYPLLATNWTIYKRPDEGNHTGGIKAIAFSLREDVMFHDGSEFNATVVEWNLNRSLIISGNLTGNGDPLMSGLFWYDLDEWKDYFTPKWDLSWGLGDPNLFGKENLIPMINSTEILSDHLINITFNPWTVDVSIFHSPYYSMISMESYGDWWDSAIYGMGDVPEFPQTNPAVFPGHLIGTGPYKFEYVDLTVTQTGSMTKNNDYWNRSALEADGWFIFTDIEVRHFVDVQVRTTALLNGQLDWLGDQRQIPITDLDGVISHPRLKLYNIRSDRAPFFINMISREGLDTPSNFYWSMPPLGPKFLTSREAWQILAGFLGFDPIANPITQGINRTIRRAISYAFDYENYYVALSGSGNLSQSIYGSQSPFHNPTVVPEPYYNVTKAREIILSDPHYGPLCANRLLTISNTSEEWNNIAETNPLENHTLLNTPGSNLPNFLGPALADIGCDFSYKDSTNIIASVLLGEYLLYDMAPFMLDVTPYDPRSSLLAYFASTNRYIPNFALNLNFMANSTIDNLLHEIHFKNITTIQDDLDFLANHIQNFDVPWILIERHMLKFAMNSGFTYHPHMPYFRNNMVPNYALITGTRLTASEEAIPGYSPLLGIFASGITILGIIYVLMRKKNQNI